MSGLIEMSLVFGAALLVAIVELMMLRRARRRDDQQAREAHTAEDRRD